MNILWFLALIYVVYADTLFGSSYLKNSELCKPWTCISSKLGLPDSLPPKEQFSDLLKSLLPNGDWQEAAQKAVDVCYGKRTRRYTPTCPAQSLLHCVVDELIENCPASNWKKDDACTPITSLAGFKYMFSQSRYQNLEKNLANERRPAWFLKNFFSSKCCDIPNILNSTVLDECGFNTIIRYYEMKPHNGHGTSFNFNFIHFVTQKPNVSEYKVNVADLNSNTMDPLDCCDVSDLVKNQWRDECNFHLSWDDEKRLTIQEDTELTTETPSTSAIPPKLDVKVVPLACEQEICVFEKLKVITSSGKVNSDAFLSLLNNMTENHPEWNKAKARVFTTCLSNPMHDYSHTCEINKVLECTFDVLSENCPTAKKDDPCKHKKYINGLKGEDSLCQVSSAKYRPKNRRQFCNIPNLVNDEILSKCGISSLSRFEYIPATITSKPKKHWWSPSSVCKDLTKSTKCVLNKMNVMSKYGFIDYFKMKDRIRKVTSQHPWNSMSSLSVGAFMTYPMYRDQCRSPRQFLNVLDTMIMMCPISKRIHTEQCNKFFKQKSEVAKDHFNHIFLPPMPTTTTSRPIHAPIPKRQGKPDLPTGLPPVETIDLKPQAIIKKKPLVILPVYLRTNGKGNLSISPKNGPLLRSNHFELPQLP